MSLLINKIIYLLWEEKKMERKHSNLTSQLESVASKS